MNDKKITVNFNHFVRLFVSILGICLLTFIGQANAAISQSVDRNEIHAGESFVFTIQIDNDSGAEPDLSLIPKEFTIISNSQYQQMSYVNGRSTTIKGWKIKLSTLNTGTITIPSINVGSEKTQAITLNIKDTSDRVDLQGQNKAIFLETDISSNKIYVQQQIIFTVKLYRAINTHYARLTEPTAGDSIIEKLGDDVQYDKTIDNTRYVVTERRYAIFPQQSGELEIESVNFTADINDPNSRGNNRFLNTTRPISVNSKPIKVEVEHQPTTASSPWMPALEVVLADRWTPVTEELTVGEPVTWTILLYAQGLSESQLPEIKLPKVSGLQFYPDTPQKERQINDRGILGQRIEKLAVIPSKEGKITIPAIEVKWWDTESNTEKTATIAARTFKVVAGEATVITQNEPEQIGPIVEQPKIQEDSVPNYWKTAAIGFLILWIITLIGYIKAGSKSATRLNKRPTKNQDKQVTLTESQLLKNLSHAIKANQLEAIESCLLKWASNLSTTSILSLGQLVSCLTEQSVKDKINQLQSSRYSENNHQFEANISKSDLEHIASVLQTNESAKNDSEIPPLYS